MRQRRNGADHPERRRGGRDDGFLLLETVIAITIITVVMAALTSLLIGTTHTAVRNRGAQTAAQLAVAALDRAYAIGGADVQTQLPAGPVTQTVGGAAFGVSYAFAQCWRPTATTGDCTASQAAGSVPYIRVTASVGWQATGCPAAGCTYSSAILLNALKDPVFNFAQTPPPPIALAPLSCPTKPIGTQLSLQVSATGGVSPYVFNATGLPPGLSMDANGLITGAITKSGSYPVSVTVTDAFLTQAQGTPLFTCTVGYPALAFTTPANQTNNGGDVVKLQVAGASGGDGNYTWTATGLPPGLSINPTSGLISGTVTSPGSSSKTYTPVVTLADGSGTTPVSHSFTWTVLPPCVVYANPTVNGYPQPVSQSDPRITTSPAHYVWTTTNTNWWVVSPTLAGSCSTGPYSFQSVSMNYIQAGDPNPYEPAQGGIACLSSPTSNCVSKTNGSVNLFNPQASSTYCVTVKATDGAGNPRTFKFAWKFAQQNGYGQVISPLPPNTIPSCWPS